MPFTEACIWAATAVLKLSLDRSTAMRTAGIDCHSRYRRVVRTAPGGQYDIVRMSVARLATDARLVVKRKCEHSESFPECILIERVMMNTIKTMSTSKA